MTQEEDFDALCRAVRSISNAIVPSNTLPGRDEHGGHIDSLTEAVMSVGRSLDGIARAIEGLADAIEARG